MLPARAPQFEQKRPVAGMSVPHDEQVGIKFPASVYRFRTERAYSRAFRLGNPCRRYISFTFRVASQLLMHFGGAADASLNVVRARGP